MKKILVCFFGMYVFLQLSFAYELKVTEAYLDGTDEWIELTNISADPFMGSLTLSGVKSSLLTLPSMTIPGYTSVVVGDNLSMLSTLNGLFVLTGNGLSITDTTPLDITLLSDGNSLDTFRVDAGTVQANDNAMTSFQKVRNNGGFDILPSVAFYSYGVNLPYRASPGTVYRLDGTVFGAGDIPGTGTIDPPLGSGSQLGTGTVSLSGDIGSEDVSLGFQDCNLYNHTFLVDEVYNGSSYSHYIELIPLIDMTGSLSIFGSALSLTIITPPLSRKKNERYLITNGMLGFTHQENIIALSGWILSAGSFIVAIDGASAIGGQVDTVGQSLNAVAVTGGCTTLFSSGVAPSPGFDKVFLSYIPTRTEMVVVTGSCSSGTIVVSTGSSLTGSITGTILSTGSSFTGSLGTGLLFQSGDIRISLIDYDPSGSDTNNERIGLQSMIGDVNLSGWSLSYDSKTYKFLSGIVTSGIEYIRTGNFSFVNSRIVCINLFYTTLVIDTACYDPNINSSPYLPGASTGSISSGSIFSGDETFDYRDLRFDITNAVYDPDGSDTDREQVTVHFLGGSPSILLDTLRLRVGTSNKRIYGTMISGQTLTLVGNFQMPNEKQTCVALTYGDITYDEYCYYPPVASPSSIISSSPTTSGPSYQDRSITVLSADYDPEGSDADRESLVLSLVTGQSSVDLSQLYIRIGTGSRHYLQGTLSSGSPMTFTGNYQLPNNKPTCFNLMQGSYVFDTYCYDPLVFIVSTGVTIVTGLLQTGEFLAPTFSGQVANDDFTELQLEWILPNPPGKDIKRTNEKFALSLASGGGQILTKKIKLVVGKTTINLSGFSFSSDELVIISPKALSNQAACARLFVGDKEVDRICYPQTKEGLIYYNTRNKGSFAIPSSVIDGLDAQHIDIADLLLTHRDKKICLVYHKVVLRCANSSNTTTTKQNKALLTLGNAYIRLVAAGLYDGTLDRIHLSHIQTSYRTLSSRIKEGHLQPFSLYGHHIKATDLETYIAAVYDTSPERYVFDQWGRILFGHQQMDEYYEKIYQE